MGVHVARAGGTDGHAESCGYLPAAIAGGDRRSSIAVLDDRDFAKLREIFEAGNAAICTAESANLFAVGECDVNVVVEKAQESFAVSPNGERTGKIERNRT